MLKRAPIIVLCAALLAGCARQLPLTLQPNTPARVMEVGGPEHKLDPTSDAYRRLEHWISNNRSGWSWGHYYATPPPKGVIVRAGALYLQFFDSTVLARTPQGDYMKNVSPSDYAFLTGDGSGTLTEVESWRVRRQGMAQEFLQAFTTPTARITGPKCRVTQRSPLLSSTYS